MLRKIPAPIKIKSALPPPLSKKKTQPPSPPKRGVLWAWGFSSKESPKIPGAHKIGAAISGPRIAQELSGDPNPQYFLKSTAVEMGGVLPYKWEAYCSTNGRCIVGFPFLQGLEARKVQRYKWGAYCRTNWRCIAVLSPRPVGVCRSFKGQHD